MPKPVGPRPCRKPGRPPRRRAAEALSRETAAREAAEAEARRAAEREAEEAEAVARVEREAREAEAAAAAEEARRVQSAAAERTRVEAERAALVAQAMLDEAEKVRREEEKKAKDAARVPAPQTDHGRDVASFDTSNPRRAAEALFAPRQGAADGPSRAVQAPPSDPRAEAERFFNFGPNRPASAPAAPAVADGTRPTPETAATPTASPVADEPAPAAGFAGEAHEPGQHHASRRQKPERERVDIHGRGGVRRTVEVVRVRGGLAADMGPRTKLTLRGPVPMGTRGPFAPREGEAELPDHAQHTAMTLFAPKAAVAADPGKNAFAMVRKLIRENVDHGLIVTVVRLAAVVSRLDERPNLAGRVRQLIDDAMTSLSRIEGKLSPAGDMGTGDMAAAD